MGWPSPGDYNGAIQNPQAAFRDPRLKTCLVELKPGKPWPWPRAGANAIVYRLLNGSGSTAVRVFMNAPKTDRQARYEMVGRYLLETKPRCTVGFRYDPEGILVGQWLPILTMEWVEGKTLGAWFREAVERQDSAAIKKMAHEWIKLMGELRSLQIAHCDLQHGNVMVVGERLVLVDYDGMYVPEMSHGDEKNRVAWEHGLPAYQHPGRPGQLLSPPDRRLFGLVDPDLAAGRRRRPLALASHDRRHRGREPALHRARPEAARSLAALARVDQWRARPESTRMDGRAAALAGSPVRRDPAVRSRHLRPGA